MNNKLFSDIYFYNLCWNTGNNRIFWNIFNYNGICSGYAVIVHNYITQDFCTTEYRNIVF